MIATQPFINYSLPLSRVNQKLDGRNIIEAWNNISIFLEEFTTADVTKPSTVKLIAYTADIQEGEMVEPAKSLIKKTAAFFGKGKTKPIGYLYPSNKPHPQKQTEWKLKSTDLQRALDFTSTCEPLPKYNLGPLELIISYDFGMKKIDSKLKLPNQQYPSSVLIWLSRSKMIAPDLHFPFIEPNADFKNYFNKIKKHAPFKLDEKYLRLGNPNKKGTGNIFAKLT